MKRETHRVRDNGTVWNRQGKELFIVYSESAVDAMLFHILYRRFV